MKLQALINRLQEIADKYGDMEVDILTETKKTGQVEQLLGDVAVSNSYFAEGILTPNQPRAKLLPEGF